MRQLHDHKITPMNEDHVRVYAVDDADPNAGGAHHVYKIEVLSKSPDAANDATTILEMSFKFQHGPIKEAGVNGITDQALMAICLDRLRSFQNSKWSCRENAISITNLEQALMWQHKRTLDRMRRGVEGTNRE